MQIATLNILAVEDHEFQRNTLLRILAGMGATKLRGAADGREALALVAECDPPIDIIISDLDMPDMDGMEFMRHLGESHVQSSVILASALQSSLLDSVETMARAYGVPILGVIEKPITASKLEKLILRHRRNKSEPAAEPQPAPPPFSLAEIMDGLTRDEFEPFFQPKVELASGQVTGAEALARWRHGPSGAVTSPYSFINVLETSGQIDGLTWVMLRKSAAFCRRWREESGIDVSVSVNLSIMSLADSHLADRVTELVRSEGVDPQSIVLELTESAAATNVGQALENLSRLRMKGFGLSIDDYGTGYSSMQQLTRVAFTELKIDQSFVANAARQHSASVILKSSLEMARTLNITSVAEGVETRQDWDLLRLLGCTLAQGYFVAKPMAGEALLKWMPDRALADH